MAAIGAESAAISDIRYEDERQKLFIRFTDGGEYVYVGVPGEVHRSFVEAGFLGRFFVAEIRDRFPIAASTASPSPADPAWPARAGAGR